MKIFEMRKLFSSNMVFDDDKIAVCMKKYNLTNVESRKKIVNNSLRVLTLFEPPSKNLFFDWKAIFAL